MFLRRDTHPVYAKENQLLRKKHRRQKSCFRMNVDEHLYNKVTKLCFQKKHDSNLIISTLSVDFVDYVIFEIANTDIIVIDIYIYIYIYNFMLLPPKG